MIRILVQPAKRLFSKRQQWSWEIRGGNGERIDPRDTYNNRNEAVSIMATLFASNEPVELVVYDRYGEVEERTELRK